jgi:hypothetical protein
MSGPPNGVARICSRPEVLRKSWLFAGSDRGSERAEAVHRSSFAVLGCNVMGISSACRGEGLGGCFGVRRLLQRLQEWDDVLVYGVSSAVILRSMTLTSCVPEAASIFF